MGKKALIFDLDNTLYSWMDAFAPALDATSKYLSGVTKLPLKSIRESFKKVFQHHQSVEVVDAIKELDIWDNELMSMRKKETIQNAAQDLFIIEFKDHLQLFPSVCDVLKWSKNNGYLLFAFSDARAYWVSFRLNTLGIEEFFDRIYALEDEEVRSSPNLYLPTLIQYKKEQCKPNTSIISEIINSYNLSIENVYAIGDSKKKDILPANKVGIHSIWAKYGIQCLPRSRRLVSSITPWSTSQRSGGGSIRPQYTIDEFSEIINILKTDEGAKKYV